MRLDAQLVLKEVVGRDSGGLRIDLRRHEQDAGIVLLELLVLRVLGEVSPVLLVLLALFVVFGTTIEGFDLILLLFLGWTDQYRRLMGFDLLVFMRDNLELDAYLLTTLISGLQRLQDYSSILHFHVFFTLLFYFRLRRRRHLH